MTLVHEPFDTRSYVLGSLKFDGCNDNADFAAPSAFSLPQIPTLLGSQQKIICL